MDDAAFLAQPAWTALQTLHAPLALRHGLAAKYPATVGPFSAAADASPQAFRDICHLMHPGETTYTALTPPAVFPATLEHRGVVICLQMVFPATHPIPHLHASDGTSTAPPILPLAPSDSADLVALSDIAFPGYFRPEAQRMGNYFGIRDTHGTLVAMGGERLCLSAPDGTQWREISTLCTHPGHRASGHGTRLLTHLLALHRAAAARSWLHVIHSNASAIALYRRLGFETVAEVPLARLTRTV